MSQGTLDRRPVTASAVRGVFAGSPGRMRVAGLVAVAGCLLFALLGASAYQARGDALAEANADAAQLIQVQQIAIDVVRADSLLTSAFPSPGQETAAQVADFDRALDSAAKLVADAAAAQPADVGALRQVGEALGRYRQYATSARTFNRQGDQVGFGYLRQAGAALRGADRDNNPNLLPEGTTGLLPALDDLILANRHRVDDAYSASGWATVRLVGADVVALGALLGVQVWLARRTRRYVNLPLASAAVAVLAVAVVGGVIMVGAQSRADGVRSSSYAAFTSLADARIAVNAAKSDAAISFLYLRTGGSSATFRADFDARTRAVDAALTRARDAASGDVRTSFHAWKDEATGLFGKTDAAWVASAHDLADPTKKINTDFAALDHALDQGITDQVGQVDRRLGEGNLPLLVIGWLALLVGILAAVLAWGGIAQRLEDYR